MKRPPAARKYSGIKRAAIFVAVSLLFHGAVFFVVPYFTVTNKPKETLVVAFTPVVKPVKQEPQAKPVQQAKPAAPKPQQQQQPKPAPKPAPKPEPTPAPAKPEPKPQPAPVETPTKNIPEQTENKPAPAAEPDAINIVPVPSDLPEYTGDLPIATVPGSEAASPQTSTPSKAESAKNVAEGTPQSDISSDTTAKGSPKTAEKEPEPEALDGRVSLPSVQTFVSDRIYGQIEFSGKGRKLVNTPSSPDFSLTRNTNVAISFKIDRNGRTYDIKVPPLDSEIEMMLRNFAAGMRFSAVLYNEPDSATMRINLNVR